MPDSFPRKPKSKFIISDNWAHASGFGSQSRRAAAVEWHILSYIETEPPQAIWDSIMTMLDLLNAKAERWPLQVRLLLTKNRSPAYGIFGARELPFCYKNQPQQEMSLWANMVCFITACWDISCLELEKMGLFLSEDMKAHIENIYLWGGLGGNRKRIEEAAKDFLMLALTDPNPSPRTNPILWWLAVCIHSYEVDEMEGLPIQSGKHSARNVDLHNKLEALDYYARALILELHMHTWIPSDSGHRVSGPPSRPSAIKQQVLTFLEHADVSVVSRDHEIYPVLEKDTHELSTPAWQECMAHLQTLIDKWLAPDTPGPMREILSQSKGETPNRTYENQPRFYRSSNRRSSPRSTSDKRYEVMIEVWSNFSYTGEAAHDGGFGRATSTGAHCIESETDLAGANQAAKEVIELEFGKKEDASAWMECVKKDGTVRVIALFVDEIRNSKVNTWVQRRVG